MTDRVQVREAVEGDGDAIGEAHAAAWLAAYTHIFESDFLDDAAESRRARWPSAIRGFLAQPSILLVGAVNERVVAFAHAVPATVPDMAELTGFYCHPDAWESGISAALMTQTKAALADRVSEVVPMDTARFRESTTVL